MPDTTRLHGHQPGRLRGLYAITDEKLIAETKFHHSIELALKGGARIIQYRDKSHDLEKRNQQAGLLRTLCTQYDALLLINDDLELARQVNADGVHLGENDASISAARTLLGKDVIIGTSCYNQIELALKAEKEGADYIAFGAFFPSPTKPEARVAEFELLDEAKTRLNIPVCAIGGIDLSNAKQLLDAGADMLAVISGVFGQADIEAASAHFSRVFR